jgi:two-component system response regulator PilR (NtrC family)
MDAVRYAVLSSSAAMTSSPLSFIPFVHHSFTADRSVNVPNAHFRLLGNSLLIQECRERIRRVAKSNAPVTIYGESGCGKELAARDIHRHSERASQAFIAVNCGAIPEALMESEFFGHRRGAFTGASQEREGFFQAAQGGTLLLDEVADLPLNMQVKLLRAIQERRIRRLGSSREEVVDVRIISATHQNLAKRVAEGRFRQDLYYRLNVIELQLPALRERRDDIALLAEAILTRLCGAERKVRLSQTALAALHQHDFPGNVRELENILERALAFVQGDCIEVGDLCFESVNASDGVMSESMQLAEASKAVYGMLPQPVFPISLNAHLDTIERDLILKALEEARFNRTRAATLLGISFRQLRYRIQKLEIHGID